MNIFSNGQQKKNKIILNSKDTYLTKITNRNLEINNKFLKTKTKSSTFWKITQNIMHLSPAAKKKRKRKGKRKRGMLMS